MLVFPVFAALLFGGVVPPPPLVRTVSPRTIPLGAFYDGADVTVEGGVAAGSNVIVTVTGTEAEAVFSRKVRFGPIWINSGKVHISGAPSVFLRFSTAPLASLIGERLMTEYRLDEPSLIADMHIAPRSRDGRAEATFSKSYLALKKNDGSYVFGNGGIRLTGTAGGVSFVLRFHWPKQAPPGVYTIHVHEIHDGDVVRQADVSIPVVRMGFPAWLAALAENRASLYGVTAVAIGSLAGFGIDFLATLLFGKKRAVSH